MLHMTDLVEVHRRLLRHLGVERLHAAVGGSLGGMQVLQWAIDDPDQHRPGRPGRGVVAAHRREHRLLRGRPRRRS